MKKFLETHAAWLRRRATGLASVRLRRVVDDSDLAQDACVDALSFDPQRIRHPGAFFSAVLQRTAARQGARARRFESEVTFSEYAMTSSTPSRLAAQRELVEACFLALESLSDNHRAIITARILDGLSFKKCGERLGVPEAHARVTFHRAMARLRESLRRD